jgi:hypothetical protein
MEKLAVTKTEGECFTHRVLWRCAEIQYEQARAVEKGSKFFDMAALIMAFFAYEAYINVIGDRVDPEAWSNEKIFFNSSDYKGLEGKLKRIAEKCGNFQIEKGNGPYQTIKKISKFREKFTHGKIYKYNYEIKHHPDDEPNWWPKGTFDFISQDLVEKSLRDIEEFIEYVHIKIEPYVSDRWFKAKALSGPSSYQSSSTELET